MKNHQNSAWLLNCIRKNKSPDLLNLFPCHCKTSPHLAPYINKSNHLKNSWAFSLHQFFKNIVPKNSPILYVPLNFGLNVRRDSVNQWMLRRNLCSSSESCCPLVFLPRVFIDGNHFSSQPHPCSLFYFLLRSQHTRPLLFHPF